MQGDTPASISPGTWPVDTFLLDLPDPLTARAAAELQVPHHGRLVLRAAVDITWDCSGGWILALRIAGRHLDLDGIGDRPLAGCLSCWVLSCLDWVQGRAALEHPLDHPNGIAA